MEPREMLVTFFHQLKEDYDVNPIDLLQQIIKRLERIEKQMADLATDTQRLVTDEAAQEANITALGTLLTTLAGEITALQGQGVDTSTLEAALTTFETQNAAEAALIAQNQPPAPPTVPSADTGGAAV